MTALEHCRIALISASYELRMPGRVASQAGRLAMQVFLVYCLWQALYGSTGTAGGLNAGQASTYAVLGALYGRLRGPDRQFARDAVQQHVQEGTILYWYLRPLPPRAYHRVRAIGDQLYGFAWVALAFVCCRAAGVVDAPASGPALTAFLVSLLLGQIVLYHLFALVDVASFWTLQTFGTTTIVQLAQSLFAGAVVPLWFFPEWFRTLAALMPFQGALHVPLSLYIGRIPVADAGRELLVQAVWIGLLALALRWCWRRADRQIVVQGG